jgi:hypothetical protein
MFARMAPTQPALLAALSAAMYSGGPPPAPGCTANPWLHHSAPATPAPGRSAAASSTAEAAVSANMPFTSFVVAALW